MAELLRENMEAERKMASTEGSDGSSKNAHRAIPDLLQIVCGNHLQQISREFQGDVGLQSHND